MEAREIVSGGTRFASHESDAASSPDGVSREARTRASSLPVLIVVEDDPNDFALLKRALWKCGATARVWWAHTADEAMEILAQVDGSVTNICVVTDVRLPGFDGFDLLGHIRARRGRARIKFAFLTGMADQKTERRAYACGADAFFVKPSDLNGLIQISRSLQRLALD